MLDTPTIGYCLEGALVLGGLVVLSRLGLGARRLRRQHASSGSAGAVPTTRRLPVRSLPAEDLGYFAAAVVLPVLLTLVCARLLPHYFSTLNSGQLTLALTFVQELGMIAVIVAYHVWLRTPDPLPAESVTPPLRPRLAALPTGLLTFLAALPLVYLVGGLWQGLLTLCGFPVAHQNIVEIFLGFDTPLTQALFTFVAAVLVPCNEELIFRAGLFRGLRDTIPRPWAIGISALVFAAAHQDVTSFLPLAVLGAVFAIAYERTGNIGTVIIAHALFNLNTLGALMLGVNA